MADERELIAERERKVAELRAAGQNPYANGWRPTHLAADLLTRFAPDLAAAAAATATEQGKGGRSAEPAPLSEDRFSVGGRIVAHRGFGKATFVKLRDRSGEL